MAKSGTGGVRVHSSGRLGTSDGTVWDTPATVKGLKITKEPRPADFAEVFHVWHYPEGLRRELCSVYASSWYLPGGLNIPFLRLTLSN